MTTLMQPIYTSIDLAGMWNYRLDPDDAGVGEAWFGESFADAELRLPGSTNENGVGKPVDLAPGFHKESVRSLRQRYRYVGAVWYQKEIRIPDHWADKAVNLFFERVMVESRVWIDGQEAGMQDSLSVPHVHEIARFLRPGCSHLLTVRVDNRDCRHIGAYPSAYTDETQTIWNGMIGRMELQAFDKIRLQDVQVYPDAANRKLAVRVTIRNEAAQHAEGTFSLTVHSFEQKGHPSAGEYSVMTHEATLTDAERQTFELTCDMGEDFALWDEFDPAVYSLTVSLDARSPAGYMRDVRTARFGMRSFARAGTQFAINGRPTFLRGTLDCCIYPLTGYPPMELPAWERVFRIVKAYGLNHVRFHSWCPPEAAFLAADQAGLYLQVEGPVWMDTWNIPVGSHPDHYRYLPEEAQRILDTYGNHPSFCLFANGNELNGDFGLLHEIVAGLKARHPGCRQLFTLTANWDRALDPADDCFIAQTVDGIGIRGQYFPDIMADSTMLSYEEAVAKRPVPIISHEVGQYTVYPDVEDIPKYAGCLKPSNLEAIRDDLAEKGLLQDIRKFTEGSGKLAVQLYRDEIEAALRTPGMGGFQLLDLHDFPGQSTATVGILDAFWESKGLIEADQFRQFCGPTVLLLRMPKRIYTCSEGWSADLLISHYGRNALSDVTVEWSITGSNGDVLDMGTQHATHIPLGGGTYLGTVSSECFRQMTQADQLSVTVQITHSGLENTWSIWVFPDEAESENRANGRDDIRIAPSLNRETIQYLEDGGSVLLLSFDPTNGSAISGKFFPVFWSPVHFTSNNPCGIHVKDGHPVFNQFPTAAYASYQWKDLLEHSSTLCLDDPASDLEPIVQVIPNFYHNRKMANMLECRVGQGKLVLCSIDLATRLEERAAARQLRNSILNYMSSDQFQPESELTFGQLHQLLRGVESPDAQSLKLMGKDLAVGCEASASSEMNAGYSAGKGNDGIDHTMWRAADYEPGYWWMVDLGSICETTGIKIKFAREANYLYVIQVSDDGTDWRVTTNQTGQTDTAQSRTIECKGTARYVKIVYNGLPQGIFAGHYSFEVYGF